MQNLLAQITSQITILNINFVPQTSFDGDKTFLLRLNENLSTRASLLTDGEDFLVSKLAEHSCTTSCYGSSRFIDHEAFLDNFNARKLLQLYEKKFFFAF